MNITAKILTQSRFQTSLPSLVWIKKPRLINLILIFAVLISAFGVIYMKDLNRRLFIHSQSLLTAHDKLYEEWGKLLLEQSTWSTQSRVQKIALHRLNMDIPSSKEVVVLKIHPHS